jgi:iron complex transport system permease protein
VIATADAQPAEGSALTRTTLRPRWIAAGVGAVVLATVLGLALGPVSVNPGQAFLELLDQLPLISVDSGLSARDATIVTDLRLPRVVLGLLVGAMLSGAGAAYQGVFRNALADPYLLGVAAGAGLGATLAIVGGINPTGTMADPVPLAAFVGALIAVIATYAVGVTRERSTSASTLILAGVAVASFLTAVQTYVQQQNADDIRQVYSWILGRLATAGWSDVTLLLPYAALTAAVLLANRRMLDVLGVGDEEAGSLGLDVARTRLLIVVAASLGTAAAVSVSGLIGFVGIIVPHAVRLLAGTSYRVILPLAMLFGAAFLALADLIARTAASPAEIPIGVITAFLGAPFFVLVLRNARRYG